MGIVGFFSVPSVAGWIVQTSGVGAYTRKLNQQGGKIVNFAAGVAGAALGAGYRKIRSAMKKKQSKNK
ncbi:hypothetical protein [Alistipes indistinctus]|uniref:hypothetical protein n=1 Tax=Alistipes indistinctus TaxID=626932 RepID=UPI003C6BDB85